MNAIRTMTRLITPVLVALLVSGPVWAETTKAVCPIYYLLNSQNFGKVKALVDSCQPGSIISILVKDGYISASKTAARLCRYDGEIVVSAKRKGITALSCIFAGPRFSDFWK